MDKSSANVKTVLVNLRLAKRRNLTFASTAIPTATPAPSLSPRLMLAKSMASKRLGSAILDGIDFDIKTSDGQHWDMLARALKNFDQQLILSVAPQFLQQRSVSLQWRDTNNLLTTWNQWTAVQVDQVFLGFPALVDVATNGGFIPTDVMISQVLPAINQSSKYSKVMI
ncbi:acidic endochitinase-like [Prosopis cineraria]|uniref:acidic endochitinase-like n=1 Tax=Prosopis cineraria TaxID=364024 RepID=UPI00240EE068|nr:acidic endochitinase-like [Prosopis cineraria]